jgi:hypothetical protein
MSFSIVRSEQKKKSKEGLLLCKNERRTPKKERKVQGEKEKEKKVELRDRRSKWIIDPAT